MADTVADMQANRYKYFRWTPRTAWITFVYVAVVPSVLGYVGYVTEVSGLLSLFIPLCPTGCLGGPSHWEEKERGRQEGPRGGGERERERDGVMVNFWGGGGAGLLAFGGG